MVLRATVAWYYYCGVLCHLRAAEKQGLARPASLVTPLQRPERSCRRGLLENTHGYYSGHKYRDRWSIHIIIIIKPQEEFFSVSVMVRRHQPSTPAEGGARMLPCSHPTRDSSPSAPPRPISSQTPIKTGYICKCAWNRLV